MRPKAPTLPREHGFTAREALERELRTGIAATARELGAAVKIREREVIDHLEHIARSLKHQGERIEISPAECLGCSYVFTDRVRFATPGSCPECGSSRITEASFCIPPKPDREPEG